jgi:hypothetical protein
MTERREVSLPFTQTGNGANALVFVHGFLDDASFWRSTNATRFYQDTVENIRRWLDGQATG